MSDSPPKVVALVDSAGKLAGAADYDVFGRVNEVTVRQDVPAAAAPPGSWMPFGTYLQNQDLVLATLKQPARTASQRVQMRVNYAQVNTPGTTMSATDRTWVEAGGGQVAPVWSYGTQSYAGPMYGVKTNWFDVPASGEVSVRWASGSQVPASRYSGATVRSYEYRRYEAGASPTWLPLRFPGQYADEESGLFENWNRFYDPSTGRYSASDPVLTRPGASAAYAYAENRPLDGADRTGREFDPKDNASGYAIQQLLRNPNPEIALKMAKMNDDKANVFVIINAPDPASADGKSSPLSTDLTGQRISAKGVKQDVWTIYWNQADAARLSSGFGWSASSATAIVAHEVGHAYFGAYVRGPALKAWQLDLTDPNAKDEVDNQEAVDWENIVRTQDGKSPRPWHDPPPVAPCRQRIFGWCLP